MTRTTGRSQRRKIAAMEPIALTASRLQDAALARFARQGFDATSMAEIAGDVGIKKPSNYAHFRNKDALYLSLIPLMVTAELDYAKSVLPGGVEIRHQLHGYLQSILLRFEDSFRVQFWMRALYTPPGHLHAQVMAPMHGFMDALEAIVLAAIAPSDLVRNAQGLSADVLTRTYMGLIDCLQVELTYAGAAKFARRLEAVWAVFEAATAATALRSAR
jgi:AcrR family transcriptional regulator